MKIAGAPISRGVCEVPNWGYQMAPERVLAAMGQISLSATDFGPSYEQQRAAQRPLLGEEIDR